MGGHLICDLPRAVEFDCLPRVVEDRAVHTGILEDNEGSSVDWVIVQTLFPPLYQ